MNKVNDYGKATIDFGATTIDYDLQAGVAWAQNENGQSVFEVCLLTELNPTYCDMIIARYEQLTGDTAQRLD